MNPTSAVERFKQEFAALGAWECRLHDGAVRYLSDIEAKLAAAERQIESLTKAAEGKSDCEHHAEINRVVSVIPPQFGDHYLPEIGVVRLVRAWRAAEQRAKASESQLRAAHAAMGGWLREHVGSLDE